LIADHLGSRKVPIRTSEEVSNEHQDAPDDHPTSTSSKKAASTKDAARTSLQKRFSSKRSTTDDVKHHATVRRRSGRPQRQPPNPNRSGNLTTKTPIKPSQQLTAAAQHHRASWEGF
jgi:hypothetical protein